MELTGILKVKYDTAKVSDKFQKRDLVVTTEFDTPYPQHVQMQLTQDKCAMLDPYQVGDMVKVQINVRGREWSGPQGIKYFNTIEAWRIELVPGSMRAQPTANATAEAAAAPVSDTTTAPVFNATNSNDDLPF